MSKTQICKLLEITRWVCVAIGFNMAISLGHTPADQLRIYMPWIVLPLAGLTGIESVFLGETAAELSGYKSNPGYQRQSGLNNIAVAITALVVWLCRWGTHAEAAVMLTLLVFLTLSACNHAWSALKENNLSRKNLLRPIMTLLLLGFTVPFIVRALR